MLAVPSAKYHLPKLDEAFREDEYRHTTSRIAEAWGGDALALEKDFSPTLAGDALADERERILRWLRGSAGAGPPGRGRDAGAARPQADECSPRERFQVEMVEAANAADALVCFNRLWSEQKHAAYGGYDLSDRNLRALGGVKMAELRHPPFSGTGNVSSGRMILEYAKLGCQSVQLHTYFQLPLSEYPATEGSRTGRALHALVFHPETGLIAGLLDLEQEGRLHRKDGELRFLDVTDS